MERWAKTIADASKPTKNAEESKPASKLSRSNAPAMPVPSASSSPELHTSGLSES